MKTRFSNIFGVLGLLVSAAPLMAQGIVTAPVVGSKSPSGPSARRAAQLKYHPPANYIRHYLGDDRYKIAGGVWKVVSTQLDTYYHRATCPNMLRQAPDIVIGFSGSADAEESGYRADPVCQPHEEAVVYGQGSGAITDFVTADRAVKLADNESTISIPVGWRRLDSRSSEYFGMKITSDIFQPKGKKGNVVIQTINFPKMNAEQLMDMFDRQKKSGSMNGMGGFGQTLNQIQAGMEATNPALKNNKDFGWNSLKKGQWGGLRAFYSKTRATALKLQGRTINLPAMDSVFTAKGSRMYQLIDTVMNKDSAKIRNSFKLP